MADLNAAVGLAQIRKYPDLLLMRKHIAEYYAQKLGSYSWAIIPQLKTNFKESSYHLFPLRIEGISESERDLIITEVSRNGVALNVHFIPMPMLSFFKKSGFNIEDFPNAYDDYKNEISLPIYPQLTFEQLDYIIDQIVRTYQLIILKRK
jgi:dTDP-4-amino-4,6-dideoxygalactose transaminase